MNQLKKTKHKLINAGFLTIACCLILAIGIIGMSRMVKAKKQPTIKKPNRKIMSVEAIPVVNETISLAVTGYGEARPVHTADISSEISGKVVEITGLKQGDIINTGDLLFKIDSTDYQIEKQKTRIQMELQKNQIEQLTVSCEKDKERLLAVKQNTILARSNYLRLKNLYENHRVGTRSSVETAEQSWHSLSDSQMILEKSIDLYPLQIMEAESRLDEARSDFETARLNVERCVVKAPSRGRIKENNIEIGAYISKGSTLVTLADDTTLEIQVPLSDKDAFETLGLRSVQANPAAVSGLENIACTVETMTGNLVSRFQAAVHRAVKYDSETRTLYLAVWVPGNLSNQDGSSVPIMDGMFCKVLLKGRSQKNAVLAPASAFNSDNSVYVVRDKKLITVKADKILEDGDHIYLSGAFEPNDQLITTKLANPIENSLVNIISGPQPNLPDTPNTADIAAGRKNRS